MNTQDRLAFAEAEHAVDCDTGWVTLASGVRPCQRCRPGSYALWRRGFRLDARGPEAREVFAEGYRAIGLEPPEPAKGRRSAA